MDHVGVAGVVAVNAAEELHVLHREESPQGQRRVQGGGAVALAHHQAVPIRVPGLVGVHLHLMEVEDGENVHHGQGAAGVAGGGTVDGRQAQKPALGGGNRQFPDLFGFHGILPFFMFPFFDVREGKNTVQLRTGNAVPEFRHNTPI